MPIKLKFSIQSKSVARNIEMKLNGSKNEQQQKNARKNCKYWRPPNAEMPLE